MKANLTKDFTMLSAKDVPYLSELNAESLAQYARECHKYVQMTGKSVDRNLIPKGISSQIEILWNKSTFFFPGIFSKAVVHGKR